MIDEAKAVWAGLEFRKAMLLRNVVPLSAAQMMWVPAPGRVNIAWQLWHIAEVEDNWVRLLVTREPLRYPFNKEVREATEDADYPDKDELIAYLHEVREITKGRLERSTPEEFAREVEDVDFGTLQVRDVWGGIVTSFAWHAGQIAMTAKLLPETPIETMEFGYWKEKGKVKRE